MSDMLITTDAEYEALLLEYNQLKVQQAATKLATDKAVLKKQIAEMKQSVEQDEQKLAAHNPEGIHRDICVCEFSAAIAADRTIHEVHRRLDAMAEAMKSIMRTTRQLKEHAHHVPSSADLTVVKKQLSKLFMRLQNIEFDARDY